MKTHVFDYAETTAQLMADWLEEQVARERRVTFHEWLQHFGDDAIGENEIGYEEANLIIYFGMSDIAVRAMNIVKMRRKVYPVPCSALEYLWSGATMIMPMSERMPRKGKKFKEWTWVPLIFISGEEAYPKKRA